MRLKILQVGEPVLRQSARELSLDEIKSPPIAQLIELMKKTMHEAPGVGLAAPQIGESLQLAVIEDREEYTQGIPVEQLKLRERSPVPFHVIINPKIKIIQSQEEPDLVEFYEGCLSFSGFVGLVPRAVAVQVECLNEKGERITINARGWYARILQHEIDHLHGKLCVDRMKIASLTTVENYTKFWK